MLCITIKSNECVQIGAARLVNREPHSVRVGIEAPPEVKVVRDSAKNKEPRERHGEN